MRSHPLAAETCLSFLPAGLLFSILRGAKLPLPSPALAMSPLPSQSLQIASPSTKANKMEGRPRIFLSSQIFPVRPRNGEINILKALSQLNVQFDCQLLGM